MCGLQAGVLIGVYQSLLWDFIKHFICWESLPRNAEAV
jgi:hypothetical protein